MGRIGAAGPLAETLAVFEDEKPWTPLTTSEVATELACTRRGTYDRLRQLVDRGELRTKKVGASGRVWWQPPSASLDARHVPGTGRRESERDPGDEAGRDRTDDASGDEAGPNRFDDDFGETEAFREDVLERVTSGFFALDEAWRFTYLNERAEEILDSPARELVGTRLFEAFPAAEDSVFTERYREAMATDEPVEFETYSSLADAWLEVHAYPSDTGLSVYFRDVTERRERERDLERYERLIENLPIGVFRTKPEPDGKIVEANPATASIFGAESAEELKRHDVGEFYPDPERRERFSDRLERDGSVENVLLEQETLDGERIWLSVTAIATEEDGEVYFDGIHQNVTERVERERELERQREHLAAFNELNAVVREITDAVIDQSTRLEVERTVCETLAELDSYAFAWIAEVDTATWEVTERVEAGVEGYLDDIELSANPNEAVGQGPTGRAFRTDEMQVSNDVFEDPDFEPWREAAETYGYRSFAAIPLTYEGTRYGLLGVYSERPGAFTGEEQAVVGQLGEIVGHAIAAIERKRALMTDDVIEVSFRIPNLFEAMDADARTDERITIESTVQVDEDRYVQYGTGSDEAIGVLAEMADSLPQFEQLTWIERSFGDDRFEAELSSPPAITTIADHGGRIEQAKIEDGDYQVRFQLPPDREVRPIIDAITEEYYAAELVSRRQISADERPGERLKRVFQRELTDRQRSALETAYYAGFFEWPRNSTGEDLADSLGVSPPTFHQHLRLGTKRVLETLFEG